MVLSHRKSSFAIFTSHQKICLSYFKTSSIWNPYYVIRPVMALLRMESFFIFLLFSLAHCSYKYLPNMVLQCISFKWSFYLTFLCRTLHKVQIFTNQGQQICKLLWLYVMQWDLPVWVSTQVCRSWDLHFFCPSCKFESLIYWSGKDGYFKNNVDNLANTDSVSMFVKSSGISVLFLLKASSFSLLSSECSSAKLLCCQILNHLPNRDCGHSLRPTSLANKPLLYVASFP